MPSPSIVWGIEIGASSIKAMKMEAAGDEGVRILEYAVIQHPKPLSTPGVDANDVLRVSLGALTSQHDLTKGTIAVSVPGHAGFARFAKLPPVEPKKVPDIVKFEAMQQVPFPLDQVEWDYQTFISPDSPEVEVGIFAITRDRVNERLAMLADFGINPAYVVLSPLAVYNALNYDLQFGPTTPGTIIVDVGTTSTDLVIATPGRMWVRTFPIGGHQFTEALVNQFQLSYPKAEKLKREAEDSKHARQVFQAMRPIFTDLAQDIQRSIGYYQSLNRDANLTRLIGVGSTFNLPGLRKYLKQQLSMDVYRIEEFRRAAVPGAKPGDAKNQELNASALSLCTAYGLGLQALELNAVGGNLMPVAVLRKSMWKEKVPWFGLAAGISILAGGITFIGPVRDYFEVQGPNGVVPPLVSQAVSAADARKQAAAAAGVTQIGEPDFRAANMVALMEKRGVYRQIADDVAAMMEDANQKATTWAASLAPKDGGEAPKAPEGPAYTLRRFVTTYEPPADEMADLMSGNFGGESSAADPMGINKVPRIKCVLEVTTSQPEARRFADETLTRWLGQNSRREGVQLEYRAMPRPTNVNESAAAAGGTFPGAGPGAGVPAGRGAPAGRGVATGRGAAGGRQMSEQEMMEEMYRPQARDPRVTVVGEAAPSVEDQAAVLSDIAASELINKLAPVVAPDTDDQQTGVVTLTWWAAFTPPEAAALEEGGGS